jgi:hypothetical protein
MLPTFQRNILLPSSALKKEAACSAKTQLSSYQTAQYQIPVTTRIVTGKKVFMLLHFVSLVQHSQFLRPLFVTTSGEVFKYGCQMFQYQNIYGTLNTVTVQHSSDFNSNL